MRTTTRATLAACACLALGGLAAGCGDDDETPEAGSAAPAAATTGEMPMEHGDMGADDEMAAAMASMAELGMTKTDDMTIALMASSAERFFVAEGDRLREQTPSPDDDAHLMVALTDTESGIRLPDATVTARVSDADGETVFEGPLYPMVGRGMGMHYGENVDVGGAGTYEVALVVGSPRVGRHRALEKAWSGTQRARFRIAYDGTTFTPAS